MVIVYLRANILKLRLRSMAQNRIYLTEKGVSFHQTETNRVERRYNLRIVLTNPAAMAASEKGSSTQESRLFLIRQTPPVSFLVWVNYQHRDRSILYHSLSNGAKHNFVKPFSAVGSHYNHIDIFGFDIPDNFL